MSYNKIAIIGNLGSDPVTKAVGENTVTTFSVATSEKIKGDEQTTWFRVNGWNKLGQLAEEHLKKGSKVYLEGRLSQNTYTDKEGASRTSLEVRLSDLQFLTPKQEGEPKAKAASAGAGTDSSDNIPF